MTLLLSIEIKTLYSESFDTLYLIQSLLCSGHHVSTGPRDDPSLHLGNEAPSQGGP